MDRAGIFSVSFGLTPREDQLLRYLLSGDDTRHLARRMSLSENTIHDHLKSAFPKTEVRTRSALVGRILGRSGT